MRTLRNIIQTFVLVMLVASQVEAGDRTTIRGIGMGRTFTAASRGIDAIGINPANLAIPDRSRFSMVVLPFTYRLSTELFSYDIYQEFFTGIPDTNGDGKREPKLLTDDDKNRILSLLPEGKAVTRMDFETTLFGMSFEHPVVGGIGISVSDRVGIKLDLAKEYFRLFLFGFQQAGSRYDFSGTSLSAWWWREYNVSYARRIPIRSSLFENVYAGIGFKVVHGYGILQTDHYNASLANEIVGMNQYVAKGSFDFLTIRSGVDFLDSQKKASPNPFPSPAGSGYGADVGISVEVRDGIQLSLAVTDVGGISWKKNVVERGGSYALTIDDPFSVSGKDSLSEAILGKNNRGEPFYTQLPTMVRVGALFESKKVSFLKFLPGAIMLGLDYNQGFNQSLGNTQDPRFSAGMEYRIIPLLPLRTGISVGGGDGFRWAAGFGLDFHYLSLDFATENFGMLFSPKAFQMFSVSFGLKFRG